MKSEIEGQHKLNQPEANKGDEVDSWPREIAKITPPLLVSDCDGDDVDGP